MQKYVALLIFSSLVGCASSPFESGVCEGFKEWLATPLDEGKERFVQLDWENTGEESILLYASMITSDDFGEHENKLYSKVAQATHYIYLNSYTEMVASCLRLRQTKNTDEEMVFSGNYGSSKVKATWKNTYCRSDAFDGNGCFSLIQSK